MDEGAIVVKLVVVLGESACTNKQYNGRKMSFHEYSKLKSLQIYYKSLKFSPLVDNYFLRWKRKAINAGIPMIKMKAMANPLKVR